MTGEEYRALLESRLAQHYTLLEDGLYEGAQYDIAAQSYACEDQKTVTNDRTVDWYETREVCLVSVSCTAEQVHKGLDMLPEIVLSGIMPSGHHKSTVITRVFACDRTDWETVKLVESFAFSRSFHTRFWGYAECRVVLIDLLGASVYTNMAAYSARKLFVPEQSSPAESSGD